MVGAFNLISVAFAVLFVGIGTDFGIQFSVRYRAERYREPRLDKALSQAAAKAGRPLALAAAATAAGFYSFLPTDYRGVSELGLIAGTGMFIAFFSAITVLPALLTLLRPPPEQEPVGYLFLAPADRFMAKHRYAIVIGTLLVALAGTPLLRHLRFDFNPLNLRSPKVESVATLLDLMKDPNTDTNTIDVLAPSLAEAPPLMARLQQLPEVARVTSLDSFIPEDQDEKLAIIAPLAKSLTPLLDPAREKEPPADAEDVEGMAARRRSLRRDGRRGDRQGRRRRSPAGRPPPQNGRGAAAKTRRGARGLDSEPRYDARFAAGFAHREEGERRFHSSRFGAQLGERRRPRPHRGRALGRCEQ